LKRGFRKKHALFGQLRADVPKVRLGRHCERPARAFVAGFGIALRI
jgi:hypothetical protein